MNDTDILVFSSIALLLVVGVAGVWLIFLLAKHNRISALLRQEIGTPRERYNQIPLSGIKLADWQIEATSPSLISAAVPANVGLHLLKIDNEAAILRSAGDYIMRMILFLFVLLPLIAVSALMLVRGAVNFFLSPAHREYFREIPADGGIGVKFDVYAPTVGNYLRSLADGFSIYFSNRAIDNWGGVLPSFRAFLFSDAFFLVLLIVLLVLLAALVFRRTSAPLVFDRKRQVVYTIYRDKIYATAWARLQMTLAVAGRSTSPAFALTNLEDNNRTLWLPLAAWGDFGQLDAPGARFDGPVHPAERWRAIQKWLVEYMSRGHVHAKHSGRQFDLMQLLAPREGRIPEGLILRLNEITRS